MTQELFWKLYESKEIEYKIFRYENAAAKDGELYAGEVISFQYMGKFYLRICNNYSPRGYRKRYKNGGWSWAVIKEFDTREQANNYFIKAFKEFHKV